MKEDHLFMISFIRPTRVCRTEDEREKKKKHSGKDEFWCNCDFFKCYYYYYYLRLMFYNNVRVTTVIQCVRERGKKIRKRRNLIKFRFLIRSAFVSSLVGLLV